MSNGYAARRSDQPRVTLAPGDQVIRYIDGQAFVCTVIEVQADGLVRVRCHLWPCGYSALVKAHEVALVAHYGQSMDIL